MIKMVVVYMLLFASLYGCRRLPCLNNPINPAFIGFSLADIDTFVLRAYKPNDSYLHLVDTFLVMNTGATIYTTSNDTTIVYINSSNPNNWIEAGYDWQIYIPAKNKTVTIANISSTQTEMAARSCLNPINSFVQDNLFIVPKSVNTGQVFTSGYMAYIHNQ